MLQMLKNAGRAIKAGYQKAAAKAQALAVGAVTGLGAMLGMSQDAAAALPTEATAAFTTMQDNGTALFALIWPLVVFFTGSWVLIKLFKKGAHKAT